MRRWRRRRASARRLGEAVVQPRFDRGGGGGHQALKPMTVEGKKDAHHRYPDPLGLHWAARKGFVANTLTPYVGDANAQTPEFKSFLVKVEKAAAPVA